jgi:hypothetical protein
VTGTLDSPRAQQAVRVPTVLQPSNGHTAEQSHACCTVSKLVLQNVIWDSRTTTFARTSAAGARSRPHDRARLQACGGLLDAHGPTGGIVCDR